MTTNPRRILLLTNSESGQSGVHLSAAHALLNIDHDVEVHIASFAALAPSVARTSDFALRTCPPGRRPIFFHELNATSFLEATHKLPIDFFDTISAAPTTRDLPRAYLNLSSITCPWNAEGYVQVLREIEKVLDEVQPGVVGVDLLLQPAWPLLLKRKMRFHVLSPNSIRDYYQPSDTLWKWPCIGSSLPFPIPWYWVPFNIYCYLLMIASFVLDTRFKEIKQYCREQTGLEATSSTETIPNAAEGMKIFFPTQRELDFPMGELPEHFIPCGTVVKPCPPVHEVDAEFDAWLSRGPTVYVNLGTLRTTSEDAAVEMALALRQLFVSIESMEDKAPHHLQRLQVLWKLKQKGEYSVADPGCPVYDVLSKEIGQGRVRITSWIKPEPISVLQTGHVVCSVHHGGANSSIEAVYTGVPQVVLAAWLDCYDWAHRAEYFGIGRWGNRRSPPRWNAEELGQQLVEVVLGKKSDLMRRNARELGEVCKKGEPGRDVLARHLLGFL